MPELWVVPGLNDTPKANRVHIAFFGLRNAGKSTLVNAFTGQELAIVSEVPGTTTDPVSKAMEILPLGPCLITDTAGLDDDQGTLGVSRVAKSLAVLSTTDVAIWVSDGTASPAEKVAKERFQAACVQHQVKMLDYVRGEDVATLRTRIASLGAGLDDTPPLLTGLVKPGDMVICVCPIDSSAPKGRLILPQMQVIRGVLDAQASVIVCQPNELVAHLVAHPQALVITDSQAFTAVHEKVIAAGNTARLTSFSVLFARQKGDLEIYQAGLNALEHLQDGDLVLIAEGCTHHRQCEDIGTVKLPKVISKLTGKALRFKFCSGTEFLDFKEVQDHPSLIVQCGGCMLTRREVMRRIRLAHTAGIPITNYGLVFAFAAGVQASAVAVVLAKADEKITSKGAKR